MKSNPLVSIVLTSYNQKSLLERAFESLISQTYKNLEIIIVDDCSTDGVTIPYIERVTKKFPERVRYHIQARNVGIPKNKNTGFKMCKGDFITYLDGDDYFLPEKIEQELATFRKDPSLDVVFSNFHIISESNKLVEQWKSNEEIMPQGHIFKDIVMRQFPKSILFRFELMKSEVLSRIGYYDENISAFHDWDSRIRYSIFAMIGFTNQLGSAYVTGENGISKTMSRSSLLCEMRHVFLKNYELLIQSVGKKEAKSLKQIFLSKNRFQILKCVNIREQPLLYMKARLKFENL
ncbi:MAG: glycosyltransferase family 2 protein [Bacteroidota bacterium]